MNIVQVNGIDIDLSLAKPGCKYCYGTGFIGTQLKKDIRRHLICDCVRKAHKKQVEAQRRVAEVSRSLGARS